MLGQVHDRFPHLVVTLEGHEEPISIEFIVDTGFDGELSLPANLLRRVLYQNGEMREIRLADGREDTCFSCEVEITWNDESRFATVFLLEGLPLLGIELLGGFTMCVDVVPGGEVTVEEI
jgi:clan AA aspartic protease